MLVTVFVSVLAVVCIVGFFLMRPRTSTGRRFRIRKRYLVLVTFGAFLIFQYAAPNRQMRLHAYQPTLTQAAYNSLSPAHKTAYRERLAEDQAMSKEQAPWIATQMILFLVACFTLFGCVAVAIVQFMLKHLGRRGTAIALAGGAMAAARGLGSVSSSSNMRAAPRMHGEE